MTAKRVGLAGLLAAIAVLVWWLMRTAPVAPPRGTETGEAATAANGDAAHAAVPRSVPTSEPTVREALDDTPPDWLAEPYEFELHVRVPYGQQRTVFVGLDGASVNWLWLSGGPDARIAVRGKTPTLTVVHDSGHLRRIVLRTGVTTTIDTGAMLARRRAHSEEIPPPPFSDPDDSHKLHGELPVHSFVEGRESDDVDLSTIAWDSVVGLGGDGRPTTPPPPPTGGIAVHITDAIGTPVAGARIRYAPGSEMSRLLGGDAVQLGPFGPGTYTLHASHPEHGIGEAEVRVQDVEVAVTVALSFANCVRGHVVDAGGKPLENRRVLWIGDDGSWNNEGVTGDHGAFLFEGIANAAGVVCACAELDGAVLPAAVLRATPTPGFDHVLTIDTTACKGGVAIEPVLADAIPKDQIAVRLWQQESGLGIHLRPHDDGVFTATDLPPGSYTCEVVAPGIGVVAAGPTWVDGQHTVQMGRFTPPMPGTLVLDIEPGALPDVAQTAFDLLHLRADANLHVAPAQPLPAPTLLPAGDYALAWRDRDGHTHWERFTMKNGTTTTVRLAR